MPLIVAALGALLLLGGAWPEAEDWTAPNYFMAALGAVLIIVGLIFDERE